MTPLRRFLLVLLGLFGLLGLAVTFLFLYWGRDLPDYRQLESLRLESSSRIFARDGSALGTLSPTLPGGARVNRTLVQLKDVSPFLTAAVVTSEDRRFYEHNGVDPLGLARGFFKAATGGRVEGGSTITNQVLKNTLLEDLKTGRTAERKIKEWLLSVQVEREFSKEEILGLYLNVIYWGSGGNADLVGISAASRAYFGKSPKDLSLAESVYLATLIPNPRRYFDYEGYRPLMRSLLERMVEDGRVTQAQADRAWREPIRPAGWRVRYDDQGNLTSATLVDDKAKNIASRSREKAPHFLQQVERELVSRFGRERVFGQGGLQVYTTLDPQAQRAAERASENARIPAGATLGAVLLDPNNGDVLAMVGQKLTPGARPAEWNNAVQSRRQVGSSIKPLLYTTAVELGYGQDHTEKDAPVNYGGYSPQNYSRTYSGREVTLRYALDFSLNLPTVRLADRIGLATFADKLRELGLEPPKNAGYSLALGTLEASPLQMAAAYAAFANGGRYHTPNYLRQVKTASGEVLFDITRERPEPRQVWTPQTAFIGLDMLRGVVNDYGPQNGGLAWRARIPGREVAGKTGTTNDVRDIWFVGMTPQVVGAVWVGKQESGTLPQSVSSSVVNPPIWREMVAGALEGQPSAQFRVPPGIGYATVGGTRMAMRYDAPEPKDPAPEPEPEPEPIPAETPPSEPDDGTVLVNLDARTMRLADDSTPPEFVIQRRVREDELSQYEPQPDTQDLAPEEAPVEEVMPEEALPAEEPPAEPAPTDPALPPGDPSAPAATDPGTSPATDPGVPPEDGGEVPPVDDGSGEVPEDGSGVVIDESPQDDGGLIINEPQGGEFASPDGSVESGAVGSGPPQDEETAPMDDASSF
ncbi:membrane peptidoglycan carboxypeptidase [Deinobacterium chartae]|uniref:peptidoglycan glycosyltransferase n=1 Tax=Deinobacterium chartae TaxID=521158 RepID=A0A841HZE1_9DEIO|nr:membrane peptidoglycan carboxypeptidase [Deinobacterium chartae]